MSGTGGAKFRDLWRRHRATALLIAVGLLVLVECLPASVKLTLRYERSAVAGGQVWRFLTAHLVHIDVSHLSMNLAGLVLLWWLYVGDARPRDWILVALAAALSIGVGLFAFHPSVIWYVGLSGVLHGLWAGGGVACRARFPLESTVTLLLLAGKLVLEQVVGPLSAGLGATLPVVTVAHVYGALGGLGAALALKLWRAPL